MMDNLILASSSHDRLISWRQGLADIGSTTVIKDELISNRLETLKDDIARIKPQILLLDIDLIGLNGSREILNLRKLCADTKIIVLTGNISENMEWELLKAGVRGCCRYDISSQLLVNVVKAVQNGELWVRRTLICRLLDEMNKKTSKYKSDCASLGLLNKLTQREYEIAVRVRNGQSNKQIAQSCAITERTVKAHLTEVYLKLGVADRLNLALVLAADEKGDTLHSIIPLNGSLVQSVPSNSTPDVKIAVNRRLNA